MAVNSSTHCTPPLNRPLRRRLPPAFFIRTSARPLFPNEVPNRRLVSVRANKPGFDGFRSKKSTNLTNSEAQIGVSCSSSSSVVDFLTLCNRLKVNQRFVCCLASEKVWVIFEIFVFIIVVDNEKERMDQSWNKGSRVNCWSHVPHGFNGFDRWWHSWRG